MALSVEILSMLGQGMQTLEEAFPGGMTWNGKAYTAVPGTSSNRMGMQEEGYKPEVTNTQQFRKSLFTTFPQPNDIIYIDTVPFIINNVSDGPGTIIISSTKQV